MTAISFTLQRTLDNKWRLTQHMDVDSGQEFKHDQDRGVYDSPALAHAAIKTILNPQFIHYDANGDEIN